MNKTEAYLNTIKSTLEFFFPESDNEIIIQASNQVVKDGKEHGLGFVDWERHLNCEPLEVSK